MKPVSILFLFAASGLLLAGCHGVPAPGEPQARHEVNTIAGVYRPGNQRPTLPELTPGSGLSNYLAYALLNSPTVEAAFYDWSASVENITIARSRPDPQLTFQAYIEDSLTSLMPGLAWNFPGPGKLRARGAAAAAGSEGKNFAFEAAVLRAAFNLKSAYFKLGELDEQLRLKRETITLLENQERAVHAQNVTGAAALTDVLRVQNELDRGRAEFANLQDSRQSLQANFKAALGLTPNQPDPSAPAQFEISNENPDADELRQIALARNPQLKAMEADVRAAEAGMAVAYRERVPDFNAGLSVEVYHPPFYWPQANMTLPIWRDKLAAEIMQAKANELAAQARLEAGQIELAVNFAGKLLACRETGRNLALLQDQLLPRARQSLEIVRAGYRTGTMDFSNITGAERELLDLQLAAVQTRTEHEIALAELSLMVAGLPPAGAPF
jgi:outer membrane protein, heavy metal efflux system